jgi:large subunit ribosomal protein L13
MKKTTVAKTNRAEAAWYVVDASQETLGRMATGIARMLMGKHKPIYTPHVDTGDYIVVINAAGVQLTGSKREKKVYRSHTHHPGGLREIPFTRMQERHPEEIIRLAVRRMLPKTTLGRHMLRKLKVYAGDRHEHHAQKPTPLSFGTGKE